MEDTQVAPLITREPISFSGPSLEMLEGWKALAREQRTPHGRVKQFRHRLRRIWWAISASDDSEWS